MGENDEVVTDQDLLVAAVEQLKLVKYLLAALLVMAVGWSLWFVLNRVDENADQQARRMIECIRLTGDPDC